MQPMYSTAGISESSHRSCTCISCVDIHDSTGSRVLRGLLCKHTLSGSELLTPAHACRLQLDDLTTHHEAYARQLRDRLLREQDLAVERERCAAQDRLREAAER